MHIREALATVTAVDLILACSSFAIRKALPPYIRSEGDGKL